MHPCDSFQHDSDMPLGKPFIFICGSDDFLVSRVAKARFNELVKEVPDEFSRETINGFSNNIEEVESAIRSFRESIQTVSMFGGKRLVWLKDVSFFADSVTGRADGTLKLVEELQLLLTKVNPEETLVLISAAPVDRRRSFLKWCEKNAEYILVGGDSNNEEEMFRSVIRTEASQQGVSFTPEAEDLLLAKIGNNTRLLTEEIHKLASYAGEKTPVTEEMVAELSPNAAESDFFESTEAFFSGDLKWTLAAFRRHFFSGGNARPILASLQNRNRLLLQLRVLMDAGLVRVGTRGVDLREASEAYAQYYCGVAEKNTYNIFTQHPFYLKKLANGGRIPALRRLIDNQQEFIRAFEEIISRSDEQEEVLCEMSVRCLSN